MEVVWLRVVKLGFCSREAYDTYLTVLDHYESHHNQAVPLDCPVPDCNEQPTLQVLVGHLMKHSEIDFEKGKYCRDKDCKKAEEPEIYRTPQAFVEHIKKHAEDRGLGKYPDSQMFRKYLPTPTLYDG